MGQQISDCTDTLVSRKHKKPHKGINLNRTWNLPAPVRDANNKPQVMAVHKGQGWRPAKAHTRKVE
jgi:hypothetical protein